MEKRGVIDKHTPDEEGKSSQPKPMPNTKEAADKKAEHLTKRLSDAAEEKSS